LSHPQWRKQRGRSSWEGWPTSTHGAPRGHLRSPIDSARCRS